MKAIQGHSTDRLSPNRDKKNQQNLYNDAERSADGRRSVTPIQTLHYCFN